MGDDLEMVALLLAFDEVRSQEETDFQVTLAGAKSR